MMQRTPQPVDFPMLNDAPNPTFEPLLSAAEAGRFLGGLHQKTVNRMARRRELPAYRIGKFWRFRASELSGWLALQSTGQNPPARKEIR